MKNIAFFLICFLLIVSCSKFSSPQDIDTNNILMIFDNIKIAFAENDLEGIMQYYSNAFLHNGNNFDDEKTLWDIRLIDFTSIEFSDISIDFTGNNSAVAHFEMTLKYYEEEFSWEEPSSENGDISYFQIEDGKWLLVGNQQER